MALDFGKKLIDVRTAKGLTQEEVADKCKISTRTIQRIESGVVKPRAYTIKLISKTLEFEFFEASNNEVIEKDQKLKSHSFLWYLKDLFNLKTNTMLKISILSTSIVLIVFLSLSTISLKAQSSNIINKNGLTIEYNKDKTIKKVEANFNSNLTLDNLIQVKKELQNIGITIHYKKLEFNTVNILSNLDCVIICNDGFSGAIATGVLNSENRGQRIGFYRDYSKNSKSPFGSGRMN